VLTTINYEEFMKFHKENKSVASMCIKKLHFEVTYACVEFDSNKDLNALREKHSFDYFINTGIYVLEPAVLAKIPKDYFFDMPQLFQQLLEEHYTTKVFEMEDYWLDLGKLEDFNKGNRDLNMTELVRELDLARELEKIKPTTKRTQQIAFVFALMITQMLLPLFSNVAAKEFDFSFKQQTVLFAVFFALAIVTGLLAGSYPAFYLSSFKPVKVLQ